MNVKFLQDGDTILLPQRIHLRHHDGNHAATCGQLGAGIRGNLHPGVNIDFSLVVPVMLFRLQEISSLVNRREGVNRTPTAHTFVSCTVVVQSSCH